MAARHEGPTSTGRQARAVANSRLSWGSSRLDAGDSPRDLVGAYSIVYGYFPRSLVDHCCTSASTPSGHSLALLAKAFKAEYRP